jgi:splicing factor 3B subunit 2
LAQKQLAQPDEEEKKEEQAAAEQKEEEKKKKADSKEGKTVIAVDAGKKLSKRERKRTNRLTIAELKQLVERPDVVEVHDCNSHDPKLLIHLKSYRNTVRVPGHWLAKSKYLQRKRGIDKPPFQLPKFIEDTGIAKLRAPQEQDASKAAKNSSRQRMTPKMGKIDIDYQVLHDAFFKFQTKPRCTDHGDLYYEGKEFEIKMREKRPGDYSDELVKALGMRSRESPPPWIYNMQRYGPPPSYPNLKIPGVNCPIPPGGRWGMSEGEWGKPPVDEYGRALYGDVFGQIQGAEDEPAVVDKGLWGKVEEAGVGDEEAAEDDEKKEAGEAGQGGPQLVVQQEGGADEDNEDMEEEDESGIASVSSNLSGMETPEAMNLRKKDGTGTETPDSLRAAVAATATANAQPAAPRQLFTVLEEKKASVGGSLFGASHSYQVPPSGIPVPETKDGRAVRGGRSEAAAEPGDDRSDGLKRKHDGKADNEERATKKQKTEKDKEKSRAAEKNFRF